MSFGNIPGLSAVMMGALLIVPASAANKIETTPAAPAPAPAVYNRTFMFPATGFANDDESVRITVINTAADGANVKASCSGSILFHDSTGAQIQGTQPTPFNIGSGKIAIGDYTPMPLVAGIPLQKIRTEVQGLVQLTIDPAKWAPCSLLLTLEVYETSSKITRALLTAVIEEPIAVDGPGFGRGR